MQRIRSVRSATFAGTQATSPPLATAVSATSASDNDDIHVSGDATSSVSSSVSYADRSLHSEQERMSLNVREYAPVDYRCGATEGVQGGGGLWGKEEGVKTPRVDAAKLNTKDVVRR